MGTTLTRTWPAWLAALVALAHASSFLGAGPIDDEFIVYRFARSWVEGDGLVFQPGERVEGFTCPLYLLLIAGGLVVGVAPEVFAHVLGLAGVSLATYAVGRAWLLADEARRIPWPALALAVAPTFAWHGVAGLGTTLLAAFLAWTGLEWSRGRVVRAGVWLALACLLRQECAVFVPAFAWAHRGRPAAWLPAILSLAGWTLFRYAYFGSLVPVTYEVKKLPLGIDLAYGLEYLIQATLECGALVLLALGFLSLRARQRRGPARVGLAVGLVLHTLYVVYVGGDFVPWARFLMPTLPLLLLWGCEGLDALPRAARNAGLALLLVAPQWLQLEHANGRAQRLFLHGFFEQHWGALGEEFGRVLPPDTTVGISPIGAFGWASRLPIVDLLGLTNRAMVDVAPDLETTMKGHHRSDPEWVLAQRPDVLVLGNGVLQPDGALVINPWERALYEHPRFQAEYLGIQVPVEGRGRVPCFVRRGWERPEAWR